jgi:spore coat protein CotH
MYAFRGGDVICRVAILLAVVGLFGSASVVRAQDADFFDSHVLQRIDLTINSRDWGALKANFRANDYYPADLRWQGQVVRNLGIRSRGGGSRNDRKPGLRVDMDRYATDQSFLGLKSFILDNLTQDPSGMHERIAMQLFAMMGIPAPREAHVQLFVNGTYEGLYAIVESIDKNFLRRVFGINSVNVENDGFLFQYRWVRPWYFEHLGSNLDMYAALLDPVTHENASTVALYDPFEQMIRAISSGGDDQFASTVAPYLDLQLFMRFLAVQSFIAEWDGVLGYAGVNNFYLYRFERSTRSQFIPWDDDNAFRALDHPILPDWQLNVLVRRALNVPELRAAFVDSLLTTAALATTPAVPGAPGWLEQEIQFERALISAAIYADTTKPFSNEDFEAGADALVAFARKRSAFVRCEAGKLTGTVPAAAACTPSE